MTPNNNRELCMALPLLPLIGFVTATFTVLQMRFGKVHSFMLGAPAVVSMCCARKCVIIKNGWLVRLLQWFGGFEVHKSGDAQFDRHWYIASDDVQMVRALKNPQSVQYIWQLLNCHPKVRALHISDGQAWLGCALNKKDKKYQEDRSHIEAQSEVILPQLDALWCASNRRLKEPVDDHYGKWHALCSMLVNSLLLGTISVLLWDLVGQQDGLWLLDKEPLIRASIAYGLLVFSVCAAALLWLFWGSTRLVLVFSGVLAPLLLTLPMLMPLWFVDINRSAVDGPAYEALVQVRTYTARGSKGSTRYKVQVVRHYDQMPSWDYPDEKIQALPQTVRGVPVHNVDLQVSYDLYQALGHSGTALVRVQSGALGWPMIQFIAPCQPPSLAMLPPDEPYEGQLNNVYPLLTSPIGQGTNKAVKWYACTLAP